MASMGFSYAQIHVRQERIRRKISEEAVKMITDDSMAGKQNSSKNKVVTGEKEKKIKKKICDSRTAERVHPCASSTAAAAELVPKGGLGGHR
jgi:phosphoribosylaminoimidazole carboxylase (NCAIR synthetase)